MKEVVQQKKKHKVLKIVIISIASFLGAVIAIIGGFLIFASATELKANSVEKVVVKGESSKTLHLTDTINVMSWNVGYCGLDESQDFFMDGGTKVRAPSIGKVKENLIAIKDQIVAKNPDIVMLQEVDQSSSRTHKYNEVKAFRDDLGTSNYVSSYALNYKAGYVPYPLFNTIGAVESGILSFSKYQVNNAERRQLPIPFSWPISMLNLKRCLLVNRISIDGSDKELVMVNLHLEAYDDGAGKAKQTKVLTDFIDSEVTKGNYVVAGGDFNQRFSNVDISSYPEYKGNWKCPVIETSSLGSSVALMDSTHPTCRLLNKPYKNADKSKFQYYMLDGFILSSNISYSHVETINLDFKNSDHNPVMLELRLA